jgi:hypothetical protein
MLNDTISNGEGTSRNVANQQSAHTAGAPKVGFDIQPEGLDKGEEKTHGVLGKSSKKAWSELDKYIELLLDSK